MIHVIDTSVAVKWFVRETGHERAATLLTPGMELATPDFAIAEVANVLWRKVRSNDISIDQAQEALQALPSFFQHLATAAELVSEGLQYARKIGHSVYDCMFLAYAIQLSDAVLVTADEHFLTKLRSRDESRFLRPLAEIEPWVDT